MKNKSYWAMFALICALASGDARAELMISVYKEERNQPHIGMYVAGVGNGIIIANKIFEGRKKVRLFCMPDNLSLTSHNFKSMIDEGISNDADNVLDNFTVEFVLTLSLMETFPCADGK